MNEQKPRKFVQGTLSQAAVQHSKRVRRGVAMPVVMRKEEEEEENVVKEARKDSK